MATYPPSVPKPNEVFRRSQSFFCRHFYQITFVEAKKGFPLRSGCEFQIQRTKIVKL